MSTLLNVYTSAGWRANSERADMYRWKLAGGGGDLCVLQFRNYIFPLCIILLLFFFFPQSCANREFLWFWCRQQAHWEWWILREFFASLERAESPTVSTPHCLPYLSTVACHTVARCIPTVVSVSHSDWEILSPYFSSTSLHHLWKKQQILVEIHALHY